MPTNMEYNICIYSLLKKNAWFVNEVI